MVVEPSTWGFSLSAYIHLNPVRVAKLRLSKSDRLRARTGAGALPTGQLVQSRLATLRAYRWSSYRTYAGLSRAPGWLNTVEVLSLGGGPAKA